MNYKKKKMLNRIWAAILSVAIVLTMLPMNVVAENTSGGESTSDESTAAYGTVATYTGGTVTGNGTENVEVVIEETTLQYVEEDTEVGRDAGWWVGIGVTAPEGFSADATYKSKTNPTAEYGNVKKFADYKDGDNYIQLWFPVSAESLEKFASEGRNLTMTYAFDWNADSDYEQEIVFSVVPSGKIKLMQEDEQVYPTILTSYGTVTTYTDGTVTSNGTENVEVVIEETTLQWVEGNDLRAEGWWVGIGVTAPEDFSAAATYKSKTNPTADYGAAKNFADYKDGEDYIQLWFPVSPESLAKFASEERNLTMTYAFDWNADGEYGQEIVFSVKPSEKIVLMNGEAQVFPLCGTVSTYTGGTITGNRSANVKVLVEETELQWVEGNDLRAEGWWVGIRVDAPEGFSADATYKSKINPTLEYGAAKSFADYKDGENYIQLWFPVSPESLKKFALEERNLTMTYTFDWNADTNYEQTIEFSVVPNENIALNANVTVETGEGGSVSLLQGENCDTNGSLKVSAGSDVQVVYAPAEGKMVDTVIINGTALTADDVTKDSTNIYSTIKDVSKNQKVVVTFTDIAEASKEDVVVDNSAVLREVENTYIIKKDTAITFKTEKDGIRLYDAQGELLGGNERTKSVDTKANTTISKVQLYYQDENDLYAEWHAVKDFTAVSVVVDENGVAAGLTPETANDNGYYNSDVTIKVTATDMDANDFYSGIASVEYWITSDGNATAGSADEPISLYAYEEGKEIKTSFEEDVAVVAADNNSDNVVVHLKVTDRAGNVAAAESTLKICPIQPQISISIGGELATGASERFYNGERKATVTFIEDRESVFDQGAAEEAINITAADKDGNLLAEDKMPKVEWEHSNDGKEHKATINFTEEASYNWEVKGYVNKAGLDDEDVTATGNSVYQFVIDKTEPADLKITYKEANIITRIINYIFGKESLDATLEAADAFAGISEFTYSYTVEEGASSVNEGNTNVKVNVVEAVADENGKKSISFTIPAQFRGKVSFTAMDKAGNTTTTTDEVTSVVVDAINPTMQAKHELETAKDNTYQKIDNQYFYSGDVKFTFTINEANFYSEDVKILVSKDGGEFAEKKDVVWQKNNTEGTEDVYEGTFKLSGNGDYVVKMSYTDRSGNVITLNGTDVTEYVSDVITIDTIKPEVSISVEEGAYYETSLENPFKVTFTVKEHNFRASDITFEEFTGVDVNGNDVLGADKVDETNKVEAYKTYLQTQSNWTRDGDTYTATIVLDTDANYTIKASYSDKAGNEQKQVIEVAFCVDSVKPVCKDKSDETAENHWSVQYSKSVLDVVLETVSFGFYKAPVIVTLTAYDDTAGLKAFTYSYTVTEGGHKEDTGVTNVRVELPENVEKYPYEFEVGGKKYILNFPNNDKKQATLSFEIPAQFRGYVSFTATDKADRVSVEYSDEDNKTIVVDNKVSTVTVTYDNNDAQYEEYYQADRTATISISPDNFFKDNLYDFIDNTNETYLVITVGKQLNDEKEYTSMHLQPEFNYDEEEDVYKATIKFDENADYTFDIKYTDHSGNVYDDYPGDKFTIDKIDPVIQVSYDNNTCNNDNQFKADREATITIIEHNFKPSDVVATVLAGGTVVKSYTEKLANESSWTREGEGDVYTAKISYTDEAHYTFGISYSDKAGNGNNDVDYGTSVAPTGFTLDKSAPTEMDIRIDDVSVVGSMETLAFDKFYGKAVTIKLSANCDISGLQSMQYQKVTEVAQYNENGTWSAYDAEKGIMVAPNEKFIIYFRAEDRAGNVSIIRSTGIVVDDKLPTGETNAPEIDIFPEGIGIVHNSNVGVSIKVIDPAFIGENAGKTGYYSGLKNVTYKIYAADIDMSEEGELLSTYPDGIVRDKDGLISSWSGNIDVSSAFNSNNVIVEVTATDNAGNTRTSSTSAGSIMIDTTAPVIEINYDNNNVDGNGYFNANRVATITITERNFSDSDVHIAITNTDGIIPGISSWNESGAGGNGDDTKWTATIEYTEDGDYTFDIAFADNAGNACTSINYAADSVAPTAFTIDKTIPVVDVLYDNNTARNTNYYNAGRTAVVRVKEHNFNSERVEITMSATNDGVAIAVPAVSGWTSNGDEHTAVIRYTSDALYTFDVSVRDNAGNEAADFVAQSFYIDQTAPTLMITGVENNSANSGAVIPVVTYYDTNYDPAQVTITLVGANRKKVALDGTYVNIHNGREFTFADFAREKEMDDIYTLTATLTDKAGNTSTEEITFSVNRFGSTYMIDEAIEKLNGSYVQAPMDVVITEINTNELSNIKLTLFKNNETIILKEGTDYRIDVEGGNGEWYQYTYTIFKSNFEDDGIYRLSLYSEDEAGNVSENTLDTKNMEISFGVDKTKPNIIVENLESGITYALEGMTAKLSISDNLLLHTVMVYLDDFNTPYKTWTAEEIAEIIAGNGEFSFDIPGDSTGAHEVRIVSADVAGNEQIAEISDFFVTTNLLVRYVNNKPLFYGSIAGMVLLIGITIFLIVYKREKDEEEA